jgi:hypothetical protein
MGRIGKKIGKALGGILGSEASKNKYAKKAFGMGIGNKKLLVTGGQKLGEKVGSFVPFARGGVAVVVKAPKKRRTRK